MDTGQLVIKIHNCPPSKNYSEFIFTWSEVSPNICTSDWLVALSVLNLIMIPIKVVLSEKKQTIPFN